MARARALAYRGGMAKEKDPPKPADEHDDHPRRTPDESGEHESPAHVARQLREIFRKGLRF